METSLDISSGFFIIEKTENERDAKQNKMSFIENFGIDFILPSLYVIHAMINS